MTDLPDGPPRELTPVEKARHGFALTGEEARAVWDALDRLARGRKDRPRHFYTLLSYLPRKVRDMAKVPT